MDYAININIVEELLAISRGECGHCRVGATHKHNKCCEKTEYKENYQDMVHCEKCNTMYPAQLKKCPMCN